MRLSIEVEVRRGPIAESRHRIQAAVCDAAGTVRASTDRSGGITTFRSAAKPFQLLPLVERGHAREWGFSDEELAIMAASHTGSAYHLELVRGILERAGLEPRHLACGYHEPLDPESLERVRREPDERSPLYNNCSGKHAGMLCLARSEGWPLEGYHLPGHPLQQLMRRTVAEVCGVVPDDVAIAVDGCSVCVFGLPLAAMARGYAVLASARPAGSDRERALDRIRRAMMSHPAATGGAARFSTALMEACGGRIVAKGGAEGLECVGLPESGLGVAVKVEDGASRAVGPAAIAVLESLGAIPASSAALDGLRSPPIHNAVGAEVGHLVALLTAAAPAGG